MDIDNDGNQNQFGDEDFIYMKSMEIEPPPKHENNIADGFIIIDDEKMPVKRRELLDKKMSVIMPEAFALMPQETAKLKYPSENRPAVIYTNEDTTVNLTFTHRDEEASNEDIPGVKDAIEPLVMRMFPASSVIDSDTIDASGKNISFYDYPTPALDIDIYNLTFMFSLEGRLVLGGFNCPVGSMDDWKPVFLQMLGSVEMN